MQFCDEKGDDIIPLCTINAYIQALNKEILEGTTLEMENILVDFIHKNEISTWDKDLREEDKQEKIYDASFE